ncbi:hypothetical protein ACWNS2_00870 [Planococcus plakortidis]
MIMKEEIAVFEHELKKLKAEYKVCLDAPLKRKIQKDAKWLHAVILQASGKKA